MKEAMLSRWVKYNEGKCHLIYRPWGEGKGKEARGSRVGGRAGPQSQPKTFN